MALVVQLPHRSFFSCRLPLIRGCPAFNQQLWPSRPCHTRLHLPNVTHSEAAVPLHFSVACVVTHIYIYSQPVEKESTAPAEQ